MERERTEVDIYNEFFERLAAIGVQPAFKPLIGTFRSEKMEVAEVAFEVDLPAMLLEHRGKWVAYLGAERLGFADTEQELFDRYKELYDPQRPELYINMVEPV